MSAKVSLLLSGWVLCALLTGCDRDGSPAESSAERTPPRKLTVEEAKEILLSADYLARSKPQAIDPRDVTSAAIWEETHSQLFKLLVGGSVETFVVKEQKAVHIGNGFGGFGVSSAVPYDVDKDGESEIVYAYSFGSGLHRSLISWMDLKNFTEHPVEDLPLDAASVTGDLILKVEEDELAAYRTAGLVGGSIDPSDEDIARMALRKDGILTREKGRLRYEHDAKVRD